MKTSPRSSSKGRHPNIFKDFYHIAVSLMDKLGAYENRADKYVNCFRRYVNDAKVAADMGCGPGTFSGALADKERLVIALDVEKQLLRGLKEPGIEKVCADAHSLPFRGDSIDFVLSLANRTPSKT